MARTDSYSHLAVGNRGCCLRGTFRCLQAAWPRGLLQYGGSINIFVIPSLFTERGGEILGRIDRKSSLRVSNKLKRSMDVARHPFGIAAVIDLSALLQLAPKFRPLFEHSVLSIVLRQNTQAFSGVAYC